MTVTEFSPYPCAGARDAIAREAIFGLIFMLTMPCFLASFGNLITVTPETPIVLATSLWVISSTK